MTGTNSVRILHTFDYELFFGRRSGTPAACLWEPTEHIVKTFRAFRIPYGVVFADFLYLLALKERPECARDFERTLSQLVKICREGWDIAYHFHPHWRDAEFDSSSNQWNFKNYDNYVLSHLVSVDMGRLWFESRVAAASEIMRQIYAEAGRALPDGFLYRAGGWCIMPFEPHKDVFTKLGVVFDSSVVPGLSFPSDTQPFDYGLLKPTSKPWRFSISPVSPERDGRWLELPVTTFQRRRASVFARKATSKFRKSTLAFGDGQSILQSRVPWPERLGHLLTKPRVGLLTLETMDAIKDAETHLNNSNEDFGLMVSVTHPKGLTRDQGWANLVSETWATTVSSVESFQNLKALCTRIVT